MTNRELCSRWANEGSNVWPPRVGSQRHAPEPEHRLCPESHRRSSADDLAEPCAACFSRTNNRSARRRPLPPLRRTRVEILHILLEHSYYSQRNENTDSARRRHRRQPVASSQDPLSQLRKFQREGLPSSDRLHSSRRIRAASWRCLAVAIVARSTRGTGRKPYPSCLAGGSSDKTVQLWDWLPPVQSAPRR